MAQYVFHGRAARRRQRPNTRRMLDDHSPPLLPLDRRSEVPNCRISRRSSPGALRRRLRKSAQPRPHVGRDRPDFRRSGRPVHGHNSGAIPELGRSVCLEAGGEIGKHGVAAFPREHGQSESSKIRCDSVRLHRAIAVHGRRALIADTIAHSLCRPDKALCDRLRGHRAGGRAGSTRFGTREWRRCRDPTIAVVQTSSVFLCVSVCVCEGGFVTDRGSP